VGVNLCETMEGGSQRGTECRGGRGDKNLRGLQATSCKTDPDRWQKEGEGTRGKAQYGTTGTKARNTLPDGIRNHSNGPNPQARGTKKKSTKLRGVRLKSTIYPLTRHDRMKNSDLSDDGSRISSPHQTKTLIIRPFGKCERVNL